MGKIIVIDGVSYDYPISGSRNWGVVATNTMEAVAIKLAEISNDDDIGVTQASLVNNQTVATNIPGMVLDSSQIRSAVIQASIYRQRTLPGPISEDLVEETTLHAYRSSAGAGSWVLSQESSGSSGVIFSITSAGQFQYTSSDYTGQVGNITLQYRGTVTPQ